MMNNINFSQNILIHLTMSQIWEITLINVNKFGKIQKKILPSIKIKYHFDKF